MIALLQEEGIEHALCGGLAMAVYGLPRATIDIDLVVIPQDLERFRAAVARLGFDLPSHPMTFRGGEVEIRRVSKLHPSGEVLMLDALLVTPVIEDAWRTRQAMAWDFGTISVVSKEGLIALKTLRSSGQDLDDINRLRGETE